MTHCHHRLLYFFSISNRNNTSPGYLLLDPQSQLVRENLSESLINPGTEEEGEREEREEKGSKGQGEKGKQRAKKGQRSTNKEKEGIRYHKVANIQIVPPAKKAQDKKVKKKTPTKKKESKTPTAGSKKKGDTKPASFSSLHIRFGD